MAEDEQWPAQRQVGADEHLSRDPKWSIRFGTLAKKTRMLEEKTRKLNARCEVLEAKADMMALSAAGLREGSLHDLDKAKRLGY